MTVLDPLCVTRLVTAGPRTRGRSACSGFVWILTAALEVPAVGKAGVPDGLAHSTATSVPADSWQRGFCSSAEDCAQNLLCCLHISVHLRGRASY